MPQTRRKRRTKHRGNAAGVIESRGRTGRKPTAAEKSVKGREAAQAKATKVARYDRPPTLLGAFWRALAAAVLMLALSLALTKQPSTAFILFPIVLLLYVPLSYYTDQWLYKRRIRTKARKSAGKASSK
jgi:hypothetical protein